MKILFVVSGYYPDGAGSGTSVRNLAEGLAAAQHVVAVLRLSRDGKKHREYVNGVTIYHMPIRNIYNLGGRQKGKLKRLIWHTLDIFNPFAAWDFYKILRLEKPDVINTSVISGFSTSLFYVARMMNIRLIHTMRDYYLMCPQNAMFKNGRSCTTICAQCKPFAAARKISSGCVDMFLSNSGFVENHHRRLGAIPPEKPSFVQFNMNAGDDIAAPRKFEEGRRMRFGFIGRITETKGLPVLLEAAAKLPDRNWELKIAGRGDPAYIDRLKQIHDSDNIHYLGYMNAEEFYRAIDILICPSLYEEPLPRVVYEAYRFALPVIVARTGGTPEIVEEGRTGFVYDANDPDRLADYMMALSQDPVLYEMMSRNAAQKAKMFTRSAVTKDFLSKVQNMVNAS